MIQFTLPSSKASAAASAVSGSQLSAILYVTDSSGNIVKFACIVAGMESVVFELDAAVSTSTLSGLVSASDFIQVESIG